MGSIITLYNGVISDIPLPWKLCDGTDGTPDLRNKFIKGALNDADIGVQGGSDTHTHTTNTTGGHSHSTSSAGSHSHTWTGSNGGHSRSYFHDSNTDTRSHTHSVNTNGSHSHTSNVVSNIPPYYKSAYIMAEGVGDNFPVGSIVMWTGLLSDLPEGFSLCDGTDGIPDLRNKFIKGTLKESDIGIQGGSDTHTHTHINDGSHDHGATPVTSFSHLHSVSTVVGASEAGDAFEYYSQSDTPYTSVAGSSHSHGTYSAGGHTHTIPVENNEPTFYKLAFIKKVA